MQSTNDSDAGVVCLLRLHGSTYENVYNADRAELVCDWSTGLAHFPYTAPSGTERDFQF